MDNVGVIREIYDDSNANEHFAQELERMLEEKRDVILIEPTKIGDEAAKWIRFGNFLHKGAVVSGACCLLCPLLLPGRVAMVHYPLGFMSGACAMLYGISWQSDPCCKYQVDLDGRVMSRLRVERLTTASPLVLVRRDDRVRKYLHNTVSGLAILYTAVKAYEWWNGS